MTQVQRDQAFQLALQHHRAGRLADAEKIYRQILTQIPNNAQVLNLLGMLAGQQGDLEAAIELIRQAIASNPSLAEAHSNLGRALMEIGQLDEAVTSYRHAIHLKPDLAEIHDNLAIALKHLGQLNEALACCRQAIRLKPDFADAYNNLGGVLQDMEQFDEAIASYRHAIRLSPNHALAYKNLGNALPGIGQLDEAIAAYRQAMRINPQDAAAHGSLIFTLHFHPGYNAKTLHEEQRRWSQLYVEPLKKLIQPPTNIPDPTRRLRIGYLSTDFRNHVIGHNMLPLLQSHDHRQMEIFCYSNVARPDAITEQIRQYADVWRNIVEITDPQAIDLIRNDQIDILIDLGLHTSNNRLGIFACKPAPVQATYLGYCSSTGMDTMDYRLSDPYLDPPDSDLSVYTEQTIRLPETYWCYKSTGPTPEPSPLPATIAGHITFGCLNNFAKVSQPALDLWLKILQTFPQSRLIIHSFPGAHLDSLRNRFFASGVTADRLEFYLERGNWQNYLRTYGRIDIALDPFPWNGGITTCDALWMGVPVVTLAGQTAVGRSGKSILTNVGLSELIAQTAEQYVQIAVDLANDLPRLTELRQTLRARMQASPLTNAPRFAKNIEAAYRLMWQTWCAHHQRADKNVRA